MVPPSDYPLVECLEAFHFALVDVISNTLDPTFDNYKHMFKEVLMKAMQTHNLKMILKVHVLLHHVPKYVRRTRIVRNPPSFENV